MTSLWLNDRIVIPFSESLNDPASVPETEDHAEDPIGLSLLWSPE
jgi:hypothetical protein